MFLFLSRVEMMKLYSRGVLSFPLTLRAVNLPPWTRYTVLCSTGTGKQGQNHPLPHDTAPNAVQIHVRVFNGLQGKESCWPPGWMSCSQHCLQATHKTTLNQLSYQGLIYSSVYLAPAKIHTRAFSIQQVFSSPHLFFLLIDQVLKFSVLHIKISD